MIWKSPILHAVMRTLRPRAPTQGRSQRIAWYRCYQKWLPMATPCWLLLVEGCFSVCELKKADLHVSELFSLQTEKATLVYIHTHKSCRSTYALGCACWRVFFRLQTEKVWFPLLGCTFQFANSKSNFSELKRAHPHPQKMVALVWLVEGCIWVCKLKKLDFSCWSALLSLQTETSH